MKSFVLWLAVLGLLINCAWAEEANGLRVTAQKTTLEKDKDRDAFYDWDKVDKALGLKVAAQNVSFKDMPEGTLSFVVIVKRWGRIPEVFESYSGTVKLPALVKGAEANLTVGKVPLSGYEAGGNRKQFQDTIEGWQIIVKHAGVETIKLTSTGTFEKLQHKAKPAAPARK